MTTQPTGQGGATEKWHVVCDFETRDPWKEEEPPHADDPIWTISRDPKETGWENDSDCTGYGLKKADAEELANAANERDALRAERDALKLRVGELEGALRKTLEALVSYKRYIPEPYKQNPIYIIGAHEAEVAATKALTAPEAVVGKEGA